MKYLYLATSGFCKVLRVAKQYILLIRILKKIHFDITIIINWIYSNCNFTGVDVYECVLEVYFKKMYSYFYCFYITLSTTNLRFKDFAKNCIIL